MKEEYRRCLKYLENYNVQSFLKKYPIKKEAVNKNLLSEYQKFCLTNNLFLNEHNFYCNCSQSLQDNLKIETRYIKTKINHSKIDWLERYESIVSNLKKVLSMQD